MTEPRTDTPRDTQVPSDRPTNKKSRKINGYTNNHQ